MKTKLLTLVLLAFICVPGFSQTFKLGLKGGANFGKISGKAFTDEYKLGYHIGAFATLGFTGKFAIQPEVLFSQISADTANSFGQAYQFSNIKNAKFNTLIIPIMLNYNVNPFITLQVGPQFGVVLDKNKTLFNNGKEAFKSGDFSLVGGIQLNLLKFRIYGRYVSGLTNMDNIGNEDTWKASSIQLGLGFTIL